MKNFTARFKPGLSLFACAACALGLLLWARLLLVSHPPRIATAEPPAAPIKPRQEPAVEKKSQEDRTPAVPGGAEQIDGQGK